MDETISNDGRNEILHFIVIKVPSRQETWHAASCSFVRWFMNREARMDRQRNRSTSRSATSAIYKESINVEIEKIVVLCDVQG